MPGYGEKLRGKVRLQQEMGKIASWSEVFALGPHVGANMVDSPNEVGFWRAWWVPVWCSILKMTLIVCLAHLYVLKSITTHGRFTNLVLKLRWVCPFVSYFVQFWKTRPWPSCSGYIVSRSRCLHCKLKLTCSITLCSGQMYTGWAILYTRFFPFD